MRLYKDNEKTNVTLANNVCLNDVKSKNFLSIFCFLGHVEGEGIKTTYYLFHARILLINQKESFFHEKKNILHHSRIELFLHVSESQYFFPI